MSSTQSHIINQPQLYPPVSHTVKFCPQCHQFIVADWFIYHQQDCNQRNNININNYSSNVPILNVISSSIPSPPSIQNNLTTNTCIQFEPNDVVRLTNNELAMVIQLWSEDQIEVAYPLSNDISHRKHIIVNPNELTLHVPLPIQSNTQNNAPPPVPNNTKKRLKHRFKKRKKHKNSNIKTYKSNSSKRKTYKNLLKSKLSTSEKDILYLTNQARIDSDHGLHLAKNDTKAIVDKLYELEAGKILPCIYLIDAIVQSVGQPYIQLFEPFIANVMKTAYRNIFNNNISKNKIQKVNAVWTEQKIFAPAVVHKIKYIFLKIDNEFSCNNSTDNRRKRRLNECEEMKSMSVRPHKKRKICYDNISSDENDNDLEVISANKSIRCPLTLCVMKEPMKSNVCGHVFDRYAISDYINKMMENNETEGKEDVSCPMPGCSYGIGMKCLENDIEMELLIKNDGKSDRDMEKKKSVVILELFSDSDSDSDEERDSDSDEESDRDSINEKKDNLKMCEEIMHGDDSNESDSDSDIEILTN